MARPRKSTAALKLAGSYREDRHGGRLDSVVPGGLPEKPVGLDEYASYAWDLVVDSLPSGVLSEMDAPALTMYVRWWSRWVRYDQQLDGDDDYKLLIKAATASKQVATLGSKFGFTPIDRANMTLPQGAAKTSGVPARKRA